MAERDLIVRDESVRVAGVKLALRWLLPAARPQPGPTLVLLHEGLGCIPLWRDFPARLVQATGLPALLYDRQGHGRSDPLAAPRGVDYLHRHALEELPAVLQAAQIQDPLLVGHSDGASIALLHAARRPTRAVVALAAHVSIEQAALAGIRLALERWQAGEVEPRLARYHGQNTRGVFFAWADTWLAPWFASWDITAELPTISCPCLLLQGAKDNYATPSQLELIARGVSGPVTAQLMQGAAHAPHLEAPEQTLELAQRFVAEVLATAQQLGEQQE